MHVKRNIIAFLNIQMLLTAQTGPPVLGRSLYVVTASPTVSSWHSAATLRRVDPHRLDLVDVRTVVPDNVGVRFVLANDQARTIVVGSPSEMPKHFDLIDMNHPSHSSSFDLFREGLRSVAWFFVLPPGGERYFVLEVMDSDAKPLKWLPLAEDLRSLKEIPASWNLCRWASLSGYQGWSQPNTDRIQVFQFDDGRLTFHEGGKEVTKTEWILPKEHRFPETTWILADINNSDTLVLSGADQDRPSPARPWRTWNILVWDKLSNQ